MEERATAAAPYGIPSPGFRLHPAARPGTVRLQVADLDRSLAWYEGVLGLRVQGDPGPAPASAPEAPGSGAPRRALLGAGARGDADAGSPEPLVELRERPGAAPVPRRGRPGLYHFAILLPDRGSLGAFIEHLGRRGERAGASDHLVSEAIYLRDPDGLGVEVYADRPRSEWRHRDRQLVMATEPLDMADVVRAAGGATWQGAPAGTTIGHLHLHVGDIDRASAFYHEALGLDRVVWSYPGALFLSAGGYHHHLGLNTWAGSAAPAAEGEARLVEWELVVPTAADAGAALSSLESAGHEVERPDERSAGESEAAAVGGRVPDPWGTVLRIRAAT